MLQNKTDRFCKLSVAWAVSYWMKSKHTKLWVIQERQFVNKQIGIGRYFPHHAPCDGKEPGLQFKPDGCSDNAYVNLRICSVCVWKIGDLLPWFLPSATEFHAILRTRDFFACLIILTIKVNVSLDTDEQNSWKIKTFLLYHIPAREESNIFVGIWTFSNNPEYLTPYLYTE